MLKINKKIKQYILIAKNIIYRNMIISNNINKYSCISFDKDAWYRKYSIIAHSGGGIDSFVKTDSKEAWYLSYKNGTRVFDADLNFTRDNEIVLRHEWSDDLKQDGISEENIPRYETFMKTLIYEKYHPMSIYDVLEFMKNHTDVYVACDFKDGVDMLSKVVECFSRYNKKIIDRLIISVYDYADYYKAKELYDFKNYTIRQYEECPHNYYQLTEFCLKEKIPVCMVTKNYIKEKDNINILLKNGITVFVATVNDINRYKKYQKKGVKGIVSDWISENSL